MLQLIGTTVGMQDLSRGLNPMQVKSINKAVRGVQVRCLPLLLVLLLLLLLLSHAVGAVLGQIQ